MKLEDFPDETCAWCGKGFESPYTIQKYCCYECRRQSVAAFMKTVWREQHKRDCEGRTCQQCGKPFDATVRCQIYCSRRCGGNAWIDRHLIPERRERMAARGGRVCKECGKTFDARRDSQVHCSKICSERDRRGAKHKRTPNCVECGTAIPETRRSDATTCSLKCQGRNWNKRNRDRNRELQRARYRKRRAMHGKSAERASVMAEPEADT